MAPLTPTPSARLVRAAAAEQADLERHRAKLLDARARVSAELARIEASLSEIDERERLLQRLTDDEPAPAPASVDAPMADGRAMLRGPAVRRAAVEVLAAHRDRPEALHYRKWYEAVLAAGYRVAGKDPLAVFLTQLSRSPAVRKGTQSGVYELDRSAPQRLRRQLDRLQDELRRLTAGPTPTTQLAAVRQRRTELHHEIAQVEKALEEVYTVLPGTEEPPLAAAS